MLLRRVLFLFRWVLLLFRVLLFLLIQISHLFRLTTVLREGKAHCLLILVVGDYFSVLYLGRYMLLWVWYDIAKLSVVLLNALFQLWERRLLEGWRLYLGHLLRTG